MGYYDASVVVLALAKADVEASQHDHRQPITEAELDAAADKGIIVNMRSDVRWMGLEARTGNGQQREIEPGHDASYIVA